MASATGSEIVAGAFALLNVFLPGESIPANDGEYARTVLNDLLSELSQRDAFVPVVSIQRFDTTTGKGSRTNPYTIGPGGDWDTVRPSNQGAVQAANLILTTSNPEVRVPLGIYTDDAYFFNQIPGQTNTQPVALYYNPTYSGGLGAVYLWPVPTNNVYDIELQLQQSIAPFANLSTVYQLPEGVPRMLKYMVAQSMQGAYGRTLSPSDTQIAESSAATFKRSNLHLTDMMNDANFGRTRTSLYNILTGNG